MSDTELVRLTVPELLRTAVAAHRDEPFLFWDDTVATFGEFGESVDRAAVMWQHLGVRPGDRVAFLADNTPQFLHAWFGLAKVGGVLTAINTAFTADEIAYIVEHSQARFALVSPPHLDRLQQARQSAGDIEQVVVLGDGGLRTDDPALLDYAELVAKFSGAPTPTTIAEDDLISIIYTSGTTGRPKGVMQPHRNFVRTGQAYPPWLDIRAGDRLYLTLPLFHINSQAYSSMGALGAGASIVLKRKFSASAFWPDIEKYGVTHFNFIGAMAMILSKADTSIDPAVSKVRVAYGGTKLPPAVQEQIEGGLGCKIISGFGMSETTFGFVEDVRGERRSGSIGKPRQHPDPSFPRTEARLVDDDGVDVATGEVGELLLRNGATMLGYFRDAEATARAMEGGWLHTGDLLRCDDEGFYYFVDRKKDIIRRRGENISSVEVERVLLEHPAISGAAVVGVPSELTDEEVMACVTVTDEATLAPTDVIDWCAARLAGFKVPRYVVIVGELPRTGSHKVQKAPLREGWQSRPGLYDRTAAPADSVGSGRAG
jgi:carnitine-CoA ligase